MAHKERNRLIVIGGGAAGYFAAINAAEQCANLDVVILEKSNKTLSKVRISGGGRCNVTHACFDPDELVLHYPRGEKELTGPFHSFQPGDTFEWFQSRGVELKTEDDGRVFPLSNQSSSIIDCFNKSADNAGLRVCLQSALKQIIVPSTEQDKWKIILEDGNQMDCDHLLIATGSSPAMWDVIRRDTKHSIIDPVPSLFTFNISSGILKNNPGIAMPSAIIRIPDVNLEEQGPVLITHWGLSGPAILRASAWGARKMNTLNYHFDLYVNWLGMEMEEIKAEIEHFKSEAARKSITGNCPFAMPSNLWKSICIASTIAERWADISRKEMDLLAQNLGNCLFLVRGKSTFKDEFVTAGGINLKEINWKKMESKFHPGLYFAGEVLNIDAITGGFNFQAAWTTGWIVARSIENK